MNLSPLIAALDVENAKEAQRLVDELSPYVDIFKVGHPLFMRYGYEVTDYITGKGKKVFLDVKLHDIPNTVYLAVKAAREKGIFMLTLHASGGRKMIEHARKAKGEGFPLLLSVTVLTSMDEKQLKEIGILKNPEEQVIHLAELAVSAGSDGIVCSPNEVKPLRERLKKDAIIVTPGIRPEENGKKDDQKRTATPKKAIEIGADFIVVGRPLYKSAYPAQKAKQILESIEM